jgi:hypothetical protein
LDLIPSWKRYLGERSWYLPPGDRFRMSEWPRQIFGSCRGLFFEEGGDLSAGSNSADMRDDAIAQLSPSVAGSPAETRFWSGIVSLYIRYCVTILNNHCRKRL